MTLQQITNLTPDELRIKCATAEGWQYETHSGYWRHPKMGQMNWSLPPELTLDTCRRREMEMTDEEYEKFERHLGRFVVQMNLPSAEVSRAYLSADAITRSRAWLAAKLGV